MIRISRQTKARHLPILRRMPFLITAFLAAASAGGILSLSAQSAQSKPPVSAPGQNVQELYLAYADSADTFIRNDRWDMAEDMIRKALRLSPANPGNPMLFCNLGVCLSRQGKYGDALEAFEIGLVKAPHSTAILSSRALTYLAMNRVQDAMEDIDLTLATDSMLSQPRRIRAQINLSNGNTGEAMADFGFLHRNFPENADGATGLAWCAAAAGHPADALPLFQEALPLEKEPELQSEIYVGIIACQIALDKLNDADEAVREALKAFPRKGEIYLLRSELHRLRFRNEDAEIDKKIAREYGADPQILEWILVKNIP